MPPKTRSFLEGARVPTPRKKREPSPDPPPPQIVKDAENLLEIGQFIAKHFAKKGIQTELNIHLYPD